jgi:glycosyltransferase involved in cell wall biosynthesis
MPVVSRRIAVVPAYNEELTVARVLDALYVLVDELLIVDDGSTDDTRRVIQAWLPGREGARLLVHDGNRGMSAAYYTAFSDLRDRMSTGEVGAEDLVYTIDADGQHDPAELEELERIVRSRRLDALLARRDLSGYPRYKRLGNGGLSLWASLWAWQRFHDVESGYRIFRMGALAHALEFYKGFRYSETVEVAVVLSRLGYRVDNRVLVPVPVFRSRTRMSDALIDFAMIPSAAWRVSWRRSRRRSFSSGRDSPVGPAVGQVAPAEGGAPSGP